MSSSSPPSPSASSASSPSGATTSTYDEMRGKVGEVAKDVRDRVGEVTKDVRDRVGGVTKDVRDKVEEVTKDVRERVDGTVQKVRGTVRRVVTGDENRKVRDVIRDRAKRVEEDIVEKYRRTERKIVKRARTAVTGDANKRISDFVKEPVIVKTFDKLSFMLGVMTLLGTEFVALKMPENFDAWYLVVFGTFMGLRARIYKKKGLHYFLFDFCYFCNLLCWVLMGLRYLDRVHGVALLSPAWELDLWQAVFVLSLGPLVWAIVIWRNSLVFHEFDKVTSVFIHLLPPLLLHCARFEVTTGDLTNMCDLAVAAGNADCGMHTWTSIWLPLALYLLWQVVYVIKVDVLDAKKFAADPTLSSSTRWIVNDRRNGFRNATVAFCRRVGVMRRDEDLHSEEWKTKAIFWTTQLVYTLITVLPSYLCYRFYWWSIGICCFAVTMSVWNGANFYIEVFSRRYVMKFVQATTAAEGAATTADTSPSASTLSAAAVAEEAAPAAEGPDTSSDDEDSAGVGGGAAEITQSSDVGAEAKRKEKTQ